MKEMETAATHGQSGCVYVGRGGCRVVWTYIQYSHLCFSLCMASKTSCKNLRVLYTGDDTVFKANFTIDTFFPQLLFFLNTKSFSKGISSSQNNRQRCSWTRISSISVTSQYIYEYILT